jgi:Tol biopolymer transport system component
MLRVHRQFIVLRYTASHTAAGKRRRVETLYGVARMRADLLRISLVTSAAMLAICLLALVETTNMAEAKDSLPENGKIAFYRDHSGQVSIYTVEPDGSNLRELTGGSYPNWSPDGTKLAFVRQDADDGDISVMSADGSNLNNLFNLSLTEGPPYSGPVWSPDGTKIAFESYEDIYTMDSDGSNQTQLTKTSELSEQSPAFSPNGSQMCFLQYSYSTQTGHIYVMDSDGSDPIPLIETKHGGECDWSQDGTKITYFESLEVYVIKADGSGRLVLRSTLPLRWNQDFQPDWSPDGTKITFASDRDGDLDIYTMDADGSDVTQVTNLPGNEQFPDWQPLPGTTGVHPPYTGGPSLLLVASALLFSGGVMLYAVIRRSM